MPIRIGLHQTPTLCSIFRHGIIPSLHFSELKYKRIKAQHAPIVKHLHHAPEKMSKNALKNAAMDRKLCKNDGFLVYDRQQNQAKQMARRNAPLHAGEENTRIKEDI